MSKRLLAILGLVAALGLGAPALMADHRGQGQTSARKQAQRLGRRTCMGAPGGV